MNTKLIKSNSKQRQRRLISALLSVAFCWPLSAVATDLVVRVTGLSEPLGRLGCSLFTRPEGFPMDTGNTQQRWQDAARAGMICRFSDLPAGRYAVSVVHDINSNQRVDTNFVGLPTEQWGVSNNVKPNLRAPRFEEAAFTVLPGARELAIDIRLTK